MAKITPRADRVAREQRAQNLLKWIEGRFYGASFRDMAEGISEYSGADPNHNEKQYVKLHRDLRVLVADGRVRWLQVLTEEDQHVHWVRRYFAPHHEKRVRESVDAIGKHSGITL